MASVNRATCWVTSTSATARSRVAFKMESPNVADQHHVAGRGRAALPKHNGPGQQTDRQRNSKGGMDEPQLFEITQGASARRQFTVDGRVKPVVLEAETAEGAHQRHVVDDIDHLAIDRRGLVGEIVVQRLASGGQMKHPITIPPATTISPPAIGGLTVPISAMAATVEIQGGNTFQTNMFSTVNTALDVAVMRLVSMPGSRSEK